MGVFIAIGGYPSRAGNTYHDPIRYGQIKAGQKVPFHSGKIEISSSDMVRMLGPWVSDCVYT